MKHIFIVEDEINTRALLCMVVENHAKFALLTAESSLTDARKALHQHKKPDVFLVDLGLPDGSGITFIQEIRRQYDDVPIMVLSVFGDERHVVDAIAAGAGGYIHKDEPMEEVARHIEAVLSGDSPISPSIARHVLKRMQLQTQPSEQEKDEKHKLSCQLTSREIDVLNLLARGFSRLEAASNLKISSHTVTTHIKNIYRKMEVHSRTEAIFEASQLGLLASSNQNAC